MILACHGINKAFGEEIIVKDGSFHIEDHEKAALVGPNGAGKSTIFKIIAGELPSASGHEYRSFDLRRSAHGKSRYHCHGTEDPSAGTGDEGFKWRLSGRPHGLLQPADRSI